MVSAFFWNWEVAVRNQVEPKLFFLHEPADVELVVAELVAVTFELEVAEARDIPVYRHVYGHGYGHLYGYANGYANGYAYGHVYTHMCGHVHTHV